LVKTSKIFFCVLFIPIVFLCPFYNSIFAQQKPALVSAISFSGNEFFSSNQLQNLGILKPGLPYTNDQFELDMKNLLLNYQQEGFLDCRIDKVEKEYNFDSSGITLHIKIIEGPKILIGEIIFEGNRIYTTSVLKKNIFTKPGDALDTRTLNQDIAQILNMYESKGYPFVTVSVKDIERYADKGAEKLKVTINIEENEKTKIDKIVIEGNTSTKEEVITREIRLGKDNLVSREALGEIKLRLENLGYFQTVEQPKILKYKSYTVLLIKVTEGNTNTFDGILGYVPPNTNEDAGYVTGLVNVSLRNLFGTGRRIDARFDKEIRTTQELELKYSEPWLLGYPVNAGIGFLQRIEDTIFVKRTLNLRAESILSKNFTLSALADIERVIPTLNGQLASLYSVFDSRLISGGLEIKFDSRDYIYNPASGILYKTSYTIGQKKVYNYASFVGQNVPPNFTVQKYTVDLDFYHSFFRRQSTLVGIHGGEIKSPDLENADYFRFGGNDNVRGYRDNQFLAAQIVWSNLEFRYALTRKTFASAFFDIGYYKRPQDNLTLTPQEQALIFGYGIGVRVETGLGIFGVSYALGRGDSFLEGKVHFGIINDF
jgi:outer membrane protein insertion porin family